MTFFVPQTAPADSFDVSGHHLGVGPKGQIGHQASIDHSRIFAKTLYQVADGIWTYVGNGLSNQTFVEGPDGIIAIDSGESNQEMSNALDALRELTATPIVSIIYTHSHYVAGTAAIVEEIGHTPDIWGHRAIIENHSEVGLETSAVGGRGIIHQFGLLLPAEGPDALINCGLGPWFQDPANHPHTNGYVAPNRLFDEPISTTIAGLEVHMTPAPSDVSDSITIWFPGLDLCVNNLLWPALFNVFPIRGERFRDPTVLLTGLDQVGALGAEYLLGCHGPPLTGKQAILEALTLYRDSIQFMLDQTIRGINRGLSLDECSQFVTLPSEYGNDYFTSQLYGLVEHHVKQIYTGLRGWFDADEARLFPLPPVEKARRMVEGFGGKAEVRTQIDSAVRENDLRWALEMATWLVKCEANESGRADSGDGEDRGRLAEVLRSIGQRTTSANVRNWCLTRALELEGQLDLSRFRIHRFSVGAVLSAAPQDSVLALRVVHMPDIAAATWVDHPPEDGKVELVWQFEDGPTIGLIQRNGVVVERDPEVVAGSAVTIELSHETWARILAGKLPLSEAISSGAIVTTDPDFVSRFLATFDVRGLAS